MALQKKKMVKEGKLGKHGEKNEATPAEWSRDYVDYNRDVNDFLKLFSNSYLSTFWLSNLLLVRRLQSPLLQPPLQ